MISISIVHLLVMTNLAAKYRTVYPNILQLSIKQAFYVNGHLDLMSLIVSLSFPDSLPSFEL